MSFFSSGLSSMMNKRRKKPAKKGTGDKKKSSDKKEEGKWEMFTDTFGRPCWRHSETGEWSYGVGGGLVSPVTINPSPIGFPGAAVFTPSPVIAIAPPATKEKKKDDKKKGPGWWEQLYDDDGDRYWKHTVTKKTTYKDPYI